MIPDFTNGKTCQKVLMDDFSGNRLFFLSIISSKSASYDSQQG